MLPSSSLNALQNRLPAATLTVLKAVGRLAHERNQRAFLVGGPVRDCLLGADQIDLDIMVEGDGLKFATQLAERLDGTLFQHPSFLTATIVLPDGRELDCSTARAERYPRPGCLPQVWPARAEADLARRDFTINAMAFALHPAGLGELLDPYGGMADLQQGLLRILHPASFRDDPTRILRGARFAARFSLTLEANSQQALEQALAARAFSTLSGTRLREEWQKLFQEPDPVRGLHTVAEWGLLPALGPGLSWTPRVCQAAQRVPAWLCQVGNWPAMNKLQPWLVWHLLLTRSMDRQQARNHAVRLALPRRAEHVLAQGPEAVRRLEKVLSAATRTSEVVFALEEAEPEWAVAALAWLSDPPAPATVESFYRDDPGLHPWVTGDDLIALGLVPGPHFQALLREVRRAQIDAELADRQAALAYARRLGYEKEDSR